jgi:hypothetical protein
MITNQDDNHNKVDYHPKHYNNDFHSFQILSNAIFTYTCESDVKSLNDPSGIVEISFPCNDLNIIKEFHYENIFTCKNIQNSKIFQSFKC